ncbi:hypothetical protein D9758_005156 [Tetrapyrgos nigripes]|uniref:Timeless N-terminal domain-containing protein n=1 Tax=Tetrapyrgos nigripes TaxID=182062 RepID=A0A8H5GWU5_9AGAR|nr:hypothetical protein D9758_005156 [Tetrapyrgos nigripes]
MDNEVIEISDDEGPIEIDESGSELETTEERHTFLEPIIQGVVDALGGVEGGVYRLGDEANGCLKDLKKLWRKDETDDERTVARIFWKTRVFSNDLIPILLVTAGKGMVEDKRAISCADLMTAMTWPIDMAEELKELDDELDKGTDYTQLLQSHLHYKAAVLKPGVIEALFGIVLPPLAKNKKERTERDGQIVNIVLHLIRNLAFIRDPPPNSHSSADQAEFSTLQSRLIRSLSDTHIIDLLLTIAANTDKDPLFDSWNTIVLEILYLLFRGIKASTLAMDQAKQPADALHRLLAQEDRVKREFSRQGPTRHSRFGTTIAVKLNPSKKPPPGGAEEEDRANASAGSDPRGSRSFVIHRQQGITQDTGTLWDMAKKQKTKKGFTVDALGREENLSVEAKTVLRSLAIGFLEGCFNSFLATLLKDIRSERVKVTEKDNVRLLFLTKWFLDFFLSLRANSAKSAGKDGNNSNSKTSLSSTSSDTPKWSFGLVAEVVEREWIIWVLKRMREANDEKPKAWTELQAGIECLTQLLLLIDSMSSAELHDPGLVESAETLQQQLVYSGEVLDIAFESLKSYKEGTQSLTYLNSSVDMAYALLRMLERWSKGKGKDNPYVRKSKAKKRRRKSKGAINAEEDGVPDDEEELEQEDEDVITETMFTFEAFEMKFAHADITRTLLAFLARYNEFSSSETMRRVLLEIVFVLIGNEAEATNCKSAPPLSFTIRCLHFLTVALCTFSPLSAFFLVSTLDLFKTILANQKTFPREQPYKDLISLINFILRQFFKALEQNPFLAVEAFFPKNRGTWKQFSSWEPTKPEKASKTVEETRWPQDVQVKKGYSWSDQVGIAIAALVEAGQTGLVMWTQEAAIGQRQRIVDETDAKKSEDENDEDEDASKVVKLGAPSLDAVAKFTDYLIPYIDDEQAKAATKNPQLKLLFRLSKFYILDEDADESEWYIPSAILPSDMQSTYNVIQQFLETPFDLEGKKASQLMSKKSRRRRRVRAPASDDEDANDDDEDEPVRRKKKEKKQKEKEVYKSAQFIEDSDAEYGDIDVFFQREKELRDKIASKVEKGESGAMRSTGTKKRRRKKDKAEGTKKKRKGETSAIEVNGDSDAASSDAEESRQSPPVSTLNDEAQVARPKPRPKPRPLKRKSVQPEFSDDGDLDDRDSISQDIPTVSATTPADDEDADSDVAAMAIASKRKFSNRMVLSDDESD